VPRNLQKGRLYIIRLSFLRGGEIFSNSFSKSLLFLPKISGGGGRNREGFALTISTLVADEFLAKIHLL
jgi:hypothetical protein